VRFVKVTPRKFFGYRANDVYGRSVPISSKEKTLVDCIDRPELSGGPAELTRIACSALADIDLHELLAAAHAMKSKALLQRLGFLADLVGRPIMGEARHALRQALPKSYRSHFGRPEPRDGDIGYVAAWGLSVNARESDLLAEVPLLRAREER
jgi:predicted transcriptional regulator of viral defense system